MRHLWEDVVSLKRLQVPDLNIGKPDGLKKFGWKSEIQLAWKKSDKNQETRRSEKKFYENQETREKVMMVIDFHWKI